MNERALRVLEYAKIIARLSDLALTPIGKEYAAALKPAADLDTVKRMQKETADALSRILAHGSISFSGTRDIRAVFKRLEVGGSLTAGELLDIASVLNVAARARSYGAHDKEEGNPDSLEERFQALEPDKPLCAEIERCILAEDLIADDASAGLKKVRRQITITGERIRSELNSILAGSKSYLQESVITTRGGRYCVPVKAEHRSSVNGIVHDQSGSGSTLFIEPASVVKLNNELRELEIAEQKEIEQVLATLSASCALDADAIRRNLMTLSELDFIFARAQLAREMKASEPVYNTEGRIVLKKARHPLIPASKVVPIDVSLGRDFHTLIVTGPNTGGKTVSLKTVGLLSLMGQSGLHIPAFDGSELSLFDEVYADIGDEQSIEQSLSTFSSHMTHIVTFLEQAGPESLVLFDELCAGTDPTEGAALAMAILSFLHRMGCRVMATTHYSELKVFALTTEGVMNASCEFDVETLSPTYRLLIGIPGKSNAFAISSKLGVPGYIIDEAKDNLDRKDVSFEDLLSSLEASRKQIERDEEEIDKLKKEVSKAKVSLDREYEELDRQREELLKEAREEAQRVLQEAKDYADNSIRRINRLSSGKTGDAVKELEKERTGLRERVKDQEAAARTSKQDSSKSASAKPLSPDSIRVGDPVHILSLRQDGTVSSLPDSKSKLYVSVGIIRYQVTLSDLAKREEEDITLETASGAKFGNGSSKSGKSSGASWRNGSGKTIGGKASAGRRRNEYGSDSDSSFSGLAKAYSVSSEVNLIGMTADEAMSVLDKYLDDAYLAHLEQVRVVHGRGAGILRKATHEKLRQTSYVKEYHLGEYGEGDSGVTIVRFKK